MCKYKTAYLYYSDINIRAASISHGPRQWTHSSVSSCVPFRKYFGKEGVKHFYQLCQRHRHQRELNKCPVRIYKNVFREKWKIIHITDPVTHSHTHTFHCRSFGTRAKEWRKWQKWQLCGFNPQWVVGGFRWLGVRLGGAAVSHCPTGPLSLLLWCCHAVLATLLRMSAKSFRLSARLSASFF